MSNFSFTTREEYLAWRAEWKADYKLRSQRIRALKKEIKGIARSGAYAGNEQMEREIYRAEARNALETLAEAKAEASRQRELRLLKAA